MAVGLQSDHAHGQAEALPRQLVHAPREVGMVARVQEVDDRAMGLGLGGEIGPGRLLDLLTLGRLLLVGGVDAGHGRGREFDDIAGRDLQAEFVQKAVVAGQEFRIVRQETPYSCGLDAGLFDSALRPVHAIPQQLQDRLPRLGPVAHELIKTPFG